MKRHELEHVIRAAGAIAGSSELYIIGSQSILGQFPHAPDELLVSQEVDTWPVDDPGKADLIDGSIGELSPFHDTFGYFAHGVGPETAILPRDWRRRVVTIDNENTRGTKGFCLHPSDLAVSKMVAGREKDIRFVKILVDHHLIDTAQVRRLIDEELDVLHRKATLERWIRLTGPQ